MKILNLSTYDFGGAGTAAYRLHRNFVDSGLGSRMMVLNKRSDDPAVVGLDGRDRIFRIKNLIGKSLLKICTDQNYYFQQQSRFKVEKIVALMMSEGGRPDVIVAHWISNFLAAEDLFLLHKMTGVPVVWYLMDMAPLTGGCHYAWDCVGYAERCGKCPALHSLIQNDLSRRNWEKKRASVDGMDVTVVAATSGLYEQARRASIFSGKRLEKIMLAVDSEKFKPLSKAVAREKLNLPKDKKIIFVGTQLMKQKRKGIKYLLEALNILSAQNRLSGDEVLLAIAGKGIDVDSFSTLPFDMENLGFLSNDSMLAAAYQAADLFVCPSIEDSGPMMINESILCGTPVVAFDMGVAPDLVRTGETGFCAELKNSEDFARGIETVLGQRHEEASRMSDLCRQLGMSLCRPQVQVDSFRLLFDSVLGRC